MRITSLSFQQFRNLTETSLPVAEANTVVITGANGRGKSTVLEGMLLLSAAKSYRARQERELIQHDKNQASVVAEVDSAVNGPLHLKVTMAISPEDRMQTRFYKNHVLLKSRSDVLGYLPSVSFFVSDLQLLRGAGEDRRRWLDRAVSQHDRQHLRDLSAYEKVRRQRNQLLKTEGLGALSQLLAQLMIWDEQLLMYGAPILARRLSYIQHLGPLVTQQYALLSNQHETATVGYEPGWLPNGIAIDLFTQLDWQEAMASQLKDFRQQELARGVSLVGPHRDDVWLCLDEKDATTFASQGQQRSFVLAFKQAELQLLQQHLNDWPVLLLDDVMAELDRERQAYLLTWLHPAMQVFLTTTHLDKPFHNALEIAL